MAHNNNSTLPQNGQSRMTFNAFIRLMLKGWPLFVLSFIIAAGLMKVIAKRTTIGQPSYKMTLMSRFPEPGQERFIMQNDAFSANHLWKKNPAYQSSQLYAYITSSEVIYQAGKESGFDMSYAQKKGLRWLDVYNDLPYRLRFLDTYDLDEFSLTADYTTNGILLHDPQGTYQGKAIIAQTFGKVRIPLGDTVTTPLGRVVCIPQATNTNYPPTKLDLTAPVRVNKQQSIDAKTIFDKEMSLKEKLLGRDNPALTLYVRIGGSVRAVSELLAAMAAKGNEFVHDALQKDLTEERKLTEQALASLAESEAKGTLSAEAAAKERKSLQEELARNRANMEVLSMENFVAVIDPPSARNAREGASYLLIVLLLLAIIVPMLALYYYWLIRGSILERSQLSSQWNKYHFASYKVGKRTHSGTTLEEQVDLLRSTLTEANCVIVAPPTQTKEVLRFIDALSLSLNDSGRPVIRKNLLPEGTSAPESAVAWHYRPGYLASDQFQTDWQKELTSLPEKGILLLTITPDKIPFFVPSRSKHLLIPATAGKSRMKQIDLVNEELAKLTDLPEVHIRTVWLKR